MQATKDLRSRAEEQLKALANGYYDLVRCAKVEPDPKIRPELQIEAEGYQIEVVAANLVKSAELLLDLTSELKTQLIVSDSEAITQWRRERSTSLGQFTQQARGAVEEVVARLTSVLQACEDELAT